MQGRPSVEYEFAFGCAREDIGCDAGGAGERVNLDSLERLDAGCGQKLGTDQAGAVVHWVEAGHLQPMNFAAHEGSKHDSFSHASHAPTMSSSAIDESSYSTSSR